MEQKIIGKGWSLDVLPSGAGRLDHYPRPDEPGEADSFVIIPDLVRYIVEGDASLRRKAEAVAEPRPPVQEDTPVTERLSRIHAAIVGEPVWQGVERGVYRLTLEDGRHVDIRLEDAVVMRQIGRMLDRIVEENGEALVASARSRARGLLLRAAWDALGWARAARYADGGYKVRASDEWVVTFYVTEWDAALLRRYDELLERVAKEMERDDGNP